MTLGYDELSDFYKELAEIAEEDYEKETKDFLRKEASKCLKVLKTNVKNTTKVKTGRLRRAAKRGKAYKFKSGGKNLAIRVFFQNNKQKKEKSAPHAHLLDKGHKKVARGKKGKSNKGGKASGYVKGHEFRKKTEEEFAKTLASDAEKFLMDVIPARKRKGL